MAPHQNETMKHPTDIRVGSGVGDVPGAGSEGYDGSLELVRGADGVVAEYGLDEPGFVETGVSVDVDQDDAVVGIEILSIGDAAATALARDYAAAHGLAFPVRLEPVTKPSA